MKVKKNKLVAIFGMILFTVFYFFGSTVTNAQNAIIPWTEDFSSGIGNWQTTSSASINAWYVGAAAGNTGNGLYISGDAGLSNTYNKSGAAVLHAYRDLTFPVSANGFMLKFDWKCRGEGTTGTLYDYFRVWLVPATFTPVANSQITSASGGIQIGGNFNNSYTSWSTFTTELVATTFSNTNFRLVFEWRQDGSGGYDPPAALDNIQISEITCPKPLNVAVSNLSTNGASLLWDNQSSASNGYDYILSTSATVPTSASIPDGFVSTNSKSFVGLGVNTTYYFWVRSNCGSVNGLSEWSSVLEFKTLQFAPAILPWTENFSTNGLNWMLLRRTANGLDLDNRWFVGSATGSTINSPGGVPAVPSLYVTNAPVSSNSPTNPNAMTSLSQSLYLWAVRDVEFPAGTNNFFLHFDWKSDGRNDTIGSVKTAYLSVWLVPVTYTPIYNKITEANSGGVKLAGPLFQSPNSWVQEQIMIPNALVAGGTHRLIFEWYKDANIYNNPQQTILPPAAIDNIKVFDSVTVTNVTGVTVSTQNNVSAVINVNAGTLQMVANVLPLTASQNVSWSLIPVTGNATINSTGLVSALANGSVWAKAVSVQDASKSDSLLIQISNQNPDPITQVIVSTLNNAPAVINMAGGDLQMKATVLPLSSNQNVSWSLVPVTGNAIINASGLVTAIADGTVWAKAVSVQDASKADSMLITISNQPSNVITDVIVSTLNNQPSVINVNGGTLQMQASVLPASANQNVTWAIVQGTGTALINGSGLVTALTNGTVWAKATSIVDANKFDSLMIDISNQGVGIRDLSLAGIELFPNPAGGEVFLLSGLDLEDVDIELVDIGGKVVFSERNSILKLGQRKVIGLGGVGSGIYFLKIQYKGNLRVIKIIKD